MDYTKIPHALIYYERRSLEEFFASNPMNEKLVDNISEVYYMQKDFKERALKCMNTAYFICTLIMREFHPEWSFDTYCEIACCKDKDINIHQAVTLSLVYVYLKGIEDDKIKKLKTKLDDFLRSPFRLIEYGNPFLNDYSYLSALNQVENGLTSYSVDEKDFAFRVIDKDAVHDALSDSDFNWPKFTSFWDERRLRDIVMKLGNTEEEKYNMIDLLFETSKGFYYTKGYNPNIEEVEKKLKKIKEEIKRHFNPNIEEQITQKRNTGAENSTANIDADEQKKRIRELEGQVRNLQRNLQEANQIIEEYRQPVEELTAEQKVRMAFALQLLRAAGLSDEILNQNKSKVAKIIHLLTNIGANNNGAYSPTQICQNWLVDKNYYPERNVEIIKEIDTLCAQLKLDTKAYLIFVSQKNDKS